ncbi:hydrolase [Paucilactobacillus hokkaidonensis JCM 18461]|uniref:Hydrolase n=2 Tax=Paucilactobacillus hokkaidonensis TaxID=1193095 RepID=A0A0A1GR31_9LACO|nr:alpha/beta fold hydrolase [Paucilactobacillus hokkaidonensis]KRO09859.1 haloacid dehalogenase [Paucilactobacillus hokkaidonensis]BAP84747.1 hydrolase [Paucilactobacillus hokkaidonensis JCM 18461]
MSYLNRDDAKLYYETLGEGPVFIFIPGANGTGNIFGQAAKFMQDKFKVVMFDRRGYGKSELTKPLPPEAENIDSTYRIKTDATDVAALAKELSPNEPVYIMGTSSGSIVAMETLQDYPNIVKRIVFHEPPINSFLPTAKQDQADNNEIVKAAFEQNMGVAMQKFGKAMRISDMDAKAMSKPAVSLDGNEDPAVKGMKYWFQYEIRQYTSRKIDIDQLKQYRDRISLLDGTDSRGSYPQDVNDFLAKYWDVTIYNIPGAHLGYAQKQEGFGTTLAAVLL